MSETASAQPLTLFQSRFLVALERMLEMLEHRATGLESQFGSRSLNFVERLLSRRLDTLGLRESATETAVPSAPAQRAAATQSMTLPRTWVPSPAQLSPEGRQQAAALAAAQKKTVVAPLPTRPTSAPALPLPLPPPVAAAQTAQPAVAPTVKPTTEQPTQVRPQSPVAQPIAAPQLDAKAQPPVAADAPTVAATVASETTAAAPTVASAAAAPTVQIASAASPLPTASVATERPVVAPASTVAAAPIAQPAAQSVAAPVEGRVRDWLDQFYAAPPAAQPSGTALPAVAAAPRYSALARAFSHLGFADAQLVRSPAQRLAAAEPTAELPPSTRLAAPSLPMVALPLPVAPSRQLAQAPTAAQSGALLTPAVRLPPIATPAAAFSPTLAQVLPTVAAPTAATAQEPSRPVETAAVAAETPIAAAPSVVPALPSRQPLAAPSRERAAPIFPSLTAAPRNDLGMLGAPIFPSLAAAHVAPEAPAVASDVAAPSAFTLPGALAAQFDRFAMTRRLRLPAATPMAKAGELREWAAAPGVPVALSRVLSREESYTPQRWQPFAAPLPYLPVPSLSPASSGAAAQSVSSLSRGAATTEAVRGLLPSPFAVAPRELAQVAPSRPVPFLPSTAPSLSPVPSFEPSAPQFAAPPSAMPPLVPSVVETAPAQPWREVGGAAMLAELFAAGIGLGSGAIATQAQTFSTVRSGSLISDWLQPLLQTTSAPSVTAPSATSPSAAVRPSVTLPFAPLSASRLFQPTTETLSSRFAAAPSDEAATSAAPSIGRYVPSAQGMVFVPAAQAPSPSPSVSRQRQALPSPIGASFSQPGAMALSTERLASAQAPRVAFAGPHSPSEIRPWMQAPGISESLVRALSREASPEAAVEGQPPARWQQLTSALPYLSAPQATATSRTQPPITTTARPGMTSTPSLPFAALPAIAPSRVPQLPTVTPSAVATAPSAVSSLPREEQPWHLPGGAAALAELFAAGVGISSGAAAWVAEPVVERRGSLVADWLRPFLRAKEAPVSGQEWRQQGPSAPPLSFVPWIGPSPSPQREARRAETGAPSPTAARPTTAEAAPRLEMPRQWPQVNRLGGLSAFAEQFAAVHGLGELAPRSDEGRWVPVAGGMVYVPRQEAPRRAEGEPAIATAKPQLQSPGAWSPMGGMALRSELFATQQVARSAPPSLRELDQVSQSVTDSLSDAPQRWGFSSAGGLIYLAPSAAPQRTTRQQGERPAALSSPMSTTAPMSPMSPMSTIAPTSTMAKLFASPMATAAPSAGRASAPPRLSILDLALAGLLDPPASSGVEPYRATELPYTFAPSTKPMTRGAAPLGETLAQSRGESVETRRMWGGGLPVLSADTPSASRAARSVEPSPRAPAMAPMSAPVPDLGARYAAPMLTSFPRQSSEEQTPSMLWPQAMSNASERLQRLLSTLPVGWIPPPSVMAAVSATGVAGMPFWQRMPQSAPSTKEKDPVAAAAERSFTSESKLPAELTPGMPELSSSEKSDEEAPPFVRSPAMTLVEGDGRKAQQKRQAPSLPVTPSLPSSVRQTPATQMLSAALSASGASREQVEASLKLVEAIRGSSTSGPRGGDDRLNLGDLTLIALQMGENRMAASGVGAQAASNRITSVEKALHFHPVDHPHHHEDDHTIMKKIDKMADQVLKAMERMQNAADVRGSRNM